MFCPAEISVADDTAAEDMADDDSVTENPLVFDPVTVVPVFGTSVFGASVFLDTVFLDPEFLNPMGDASLSEKTSPHQDTQNSAHKLADASITTAKALFIVIISWVMGNQKTHAGHLPQQQKWLPGLPGQNSSEV